MKKLIPLVLSLLVIAASCHRAPATGETFVMNTFLVQTIYGNENLLREDEDIARHLEETLSRTLEDSEIALLSKSDGEPIPLSAETQEILQACLDMMESTDGAFSPFLGELRDLWGFSQDDPAVPEASAVQEAVRRADAATLVIEDGHGSAVGADLDLGAAAKGYALDKMRAHLEESGVEDALISFGGALLIMGRKDGAQDWQIGVVDPFSEDRSSLAAEFYAADVCVETSGITSQSFVEDGKRYHHIIDPATGWPADSGLASVTVVSESGLEADLLSTALFVLGPAEGLRYAEENDIAALFITDDREILLSPAFPYEITVCDDSFVLA